jgi:hypothetical protein
MFGFDLGNRLLLGVVGVVGVLVLDLVLGLLDNLVTAVVIRDTVDAGDPTFDVPILLGGGGLLFWLAYRLPCLADRHLLRPVRTLLVRVFACPHCLKNTRRWALQ